MLLSSESRGFCSTTGRRSSPGCARCTTIGSTRPRSSRTSAACGLERRRRPAYRYTVLHLAELEYRAGNLEAAERARRRGHRAARALALVGAEASDALFRALTAALPEVETRARTSSAEGLSCLTDGIFFIQQRVRARLSRALARRHRGRRPSPPALPSLLDRIGYGEPSVNRVLPNAIEALVQLGELEEARPLVDGWRSRGAGSTAPGRWRPGPVPRSASGGRGQPRGPIQEFRRALVDHERMTGAFERARTLLALGATAPTAPTAGGPRVTGGGAGGVRGRHAALGGARRGRSSPGSAAARRAGSRALRDRMADRRARLRGRSNKEVAARLFVTVRTVESNLTRVYAKLGIRRRTRAGTVHEHIAGGSTAPIARPESVWVSTSDGQPRLPYRRMR